MESTDLRIGNYIYFNDPDSEMPRVQTVRSLNTPTMNYFTPIPLDSEWLENLGFKYNAGFTDSYELNGFEIYGNPFLEGYQLESIFGHGLNIELVEKMNSKNPILYMHQLQNLYYALTGQELTLTLR